VALVFVDTSAVFALIDRSDGNHSAAKRRLKAMCSRRSEPVLTNFIVAECHALMLRRLGVDVARRWLFGNTWRVESVAHADEIRAREIIQTYQDRSFSYTDATSFAVMERLGIQRAFAFDKHFEQYGFDLI
jgi:predicted nucleic acid-binding protein